MVDGITGLFRMIKCIVPISGGKDSQLCLELAIAKFGKDSVIGLFCDTQFEHPITYQHIEWMRHYYQVEIKTLCVGSVEEKVRRYKRFPSFAVRFCTDELKTRPTKQFLKEWGKPVEVWYGMRSDESAARGKRYQGKISEELYMPHEVMPSKYPKYLGKMGVRFVLPILDWTSQEVFSSIFPRQNELYLHFDRVGCFPCYAAGDKYKEQAFKFDVVGEAHYKKTIIIQKDIKKSVWTSKGGKFRDKQGDLFQGCSLCSI